MNFLILSPDHKVFARPDSTRCKDGGDCFLPLEVNTLGFTPVIYALMCRTGKMIGREFCRRYYESVGFGVLLYPSEGRGAGAEFPLAESGVYDRSSLLPLRMYEPGVLDSSEKLFRICVEGKEIFCCNTMGLSGRLAGALVECSAHSTIHKGDFVMAELSPIGILCTRDEGGCSLKASFCGEENIDIDLKF